MFDFHYHNLQLQLHPNISALMQRKRHRGCKQNLSNKLSCQASATTGRANWLRGCTDVKGKFKYEQTCTSLVTSDLNRLALIEPAWRTDAEHRASFLPSAEQRKENEISGRGCGLPVIRFHRPAGSTAGHRGCPQSCLSLACLNSAATFAFNTAVDDRDTVKKKKKKGSIQI